MTLGPYALALSYILTKAKSKFKPEYVYKGLKMSRQVFNEQFGNDIHEINKT